MKLTPNESRDDIGDRHSTSQNDSSLPDVIEGMQIIEEKHRISQPTKAFGRFMFGLELTFLFIWPVIAFLSSGNFPLGLIFFFLALLTMVRHLFDASLAIEETSGTLDTIVGATETEAWTKHSHLYHTIKKISQGGSQQMWKGLRFYEDTRLFIEQIKLDVDEGIYKGVIICGHSLGGGLAIINGAQEKVKSFALSGPNTMLTRKSLDPAVSRVDIDKFTFNVIPEGDVVARIDDPGKNIQKIPCRGNKDSLLACHNPHRSLCEIIHACGSGPRPALCECTQFGYPKPTPRPGRTISVAYEDVCQ